MPKRTDIQSILIIGAGPIVIGQACEFDYSGVQACRVLREEGYRTILVNSNPATIMTDPQTADATYIEPITWQTLERIIAKERPDAILPTMGGQTALNCAMDLVREGVLEKYDVELIGATPEAIDKAEDRERFKELMASIGLESARSGVAHTLGEAKALLKMTGFPAVIRPSFTLGGSGGGIAYNTAEFDEIVSRGLELSPTHEVLIEESLLGWKEFEMEVVRDKADNTIIVCSIENFDPMGVHTGDSVTVAPAQTLTDREYQAMRDASMAVLRVIGVDTGGSNVQFALDPKTGRMIVIEMNPRVSRSSALASKATGFPIAKIAAKLAVGYTLDELKNDMTGGKTPASFEPSIDYVVTKCPRFAFEKFPAADDRLTTQMKSVGEVMAIGRSFAESLQKALRGLETGKDGLTPVTTDTSKLVRELTVPGPERIFYVADAMRLGMSLEEIHRHTQIDPWFLREIAEIVETEAAVKGHALTELDAADLKHLKALGFSDKRIGALMNATEADVRAMRQANGILPVYKRVDTCAAEFATTTAYLYSTYGSTDADEANPTARKKVMVLGGGPNRIGQGIEFDYCCVHAAMALREDGWETIMVNCNPETVSTDYDTSDRLYFEPVTLEDVLAICNVEKPDGVIVQYGGQTPLKICRALEKAGVPVIGTSPDAIDRAEDRERFQALINELGLKQPPNRTARTEAEALEKAAEIGYPLVVRPSYVLGGRAMEIVHTPERLELYMSKAVKVSPESPVLLDRFLDDAIELDVDAVCDGETVAVAGVMEHIEQAGGHSGDSAGSLPPYSLSDDVVTEIRRQTRAMAKALGVVGLMNVQFAIQNPHSANPDIYVLEVNPRASRTVPFVSKATGRPLAKIAVRAMAGETLAAQGLDVETLEKAPPYYCVKEAVFPFAKFLGVDPVLGPEMRSTGEVMGVGRTFAEALRKSQVAAASSLPESGTCFISVRNSDKAKAIVCAHELAHAGFELIATEGTAKVIHSAGIPCRSVSRVHEGRPNVIDLIKNHEISLVVMSVAEHESELDDAAAIRRTCLAEQVTYYTTMAGGLAAAEGIRSGRKGDVYDLQDLHAEALAAS